jgi:uracil-DNA glycosylase
MNNTQKRYINISHALDGVFPCFQKLILGDEMKKHFVNAVKSIDPNDISPHTVDIFNFAKHKKVDEINIVILGREPYPNPDYEHGLCFSSMDKNIPDSLKNIYSCLEEHKLIESAAKINTANLLPWAQQGVLMLNLSLTTRIGKSGSHINLWKPITNNIIKNLGAVTDRPIVFMLWGNYAKNYRSLITSPTAIILEENHPSSVIQVSLKTEHKFLKCDHFIKANGIVGNIDWDPMSLPAHEAFTDGSGLNTKNINSKASYACCFTNGPSKGTMLYGRLPPVSILDLNDIKSDEKWNPENNPCWIDDKREYTFNGIHNFTKIWSNPLATVYILNAKNHMIFPNSQRGEGAGILMAFEHVINIGRSATIEVITDSMFWINMLQEYIPNWVKIQRPFYLQQNPDIVSRIWKSVVRMSKMGITWSIRHVSSHGKDPNANPRDVRLNDIVDKKASLTMKGNEFGDYSQQYSI